MATPGGIERFPGFDVLDQRDAWDVTTREVVLDRVHDVPAITFFTVAEERTARALCDRLLAQDREPRVPVVELIDARLAADEGDGYRYEEMPADPDAWRVTLGALDEEATTRCGRRFAELDAPRQCELVQAIRDEDGEWHGLPAPRVFDLWIRYACTAFFSHPWSWNEIGFGGPAYPRGYANLGIDRRERWEVEGVSEESALARAHRPRPPG